MFRFSLNDKAPHICVPNYQIVINRLCSWMHLIKRRTKSDYSLPNIAGAIKNCWHSSSHWLPMSAHFMLCITWMWTKSVQTILFHIDLVNYSTIASEHACTHLSICCARFYTVNQPGGTRTSTYAWSLASTYTVVNFEIILITETAHYAFLFPETMFLVTTTATMYILVNFWDKDISFVSKLHNAWFR